MRTYIEIILLEYIFSLIFTREFLLCAHGRGRGKHNFLIGGAFRKAKYEIRRRRKKIGIGKRGRAKIPSPQPPSFLPARAIGY
jgi:hypothetical protein